MKKVAVVLSGCGYLDGSEIYESVLTFLAIDKAGAQYHCVAPDIKQSKVVNHHTGETMDIESRNVLLESGRLARGQVQEVSAACHEDFDALIFPGGFGAALNLSDFASSGSMCHINNDVLVFAKSFVDANKPLGFICIAPAMIPKICGEGVKLTIGNDENTATAIEAMGGLHQDCSVKDIVIDEKNKVVSTPAYMLGENISDVAMGIDKLVNQILKMA